MPYKDKEKRKAFERERSKRRKEYQKEYYQKNIEKMREKQRKKYNPLKEKQRKQKYYIQNKELLIEKGLLTDCIICGFPKEKTSAIDFHHVNPTEKQYEIGNLIHKNNTINLLKEANKCVCMCRNCHALYHNGDIETIEKFKNIIETRG